ncbi:hypothetical protein TWF970_000518 [Orbilia oligospora]|uniref:Uncharacterized protein n=1 Tax=Orbilia oligospora TaxID=2813651 RepID=A0A7C8W085_ORBOL|nr:hypothetical protein TWF970_000518 [Orbilia oligospora]
MSCTDRIQWKLFITSAISHYMFISLPVCLDERNSSCCAWGARERGTYGPSIRLIDSLIGQAPCSRCNSRIASR